MPAYNAFIMDASGQSIQGAQDLLNRTLSRRSILAGSAAGLLATPALAQANWPSRPIRAIVSFPPGGAIDTVTRLIAPFMGEALSQPIVAENRAGATGTIAASAVASAAPDGYTFLFDAATHGSAPFLIPNLPFDYNTAFAPVTQLTSVPLIIVLHPSVPARNLEEFMELGRARAAAGNPLTYASAGNGSASHYAAILFQQQAGWQATHVPFRGGGPAVQALLAGTVDFHFGSAASSTALTRDGRIRGVAVTTLERMASLPDLPTLHETVMPNYEWIEWNGIFAPTGTPQPILDRMAAAAQGALRQPTVQERLANIGMTPVGSTAADFTTYIAGMRQTIGRLTREFNISLD